MLKTIIQTTVKNDLVTQLGKKRNVLSIPRLEKIVVNYRVAEARESQESLTSATEELTAITGQKPQLCKAKKAVSSFKIRENDPLALKVTLRGGRMYDFVEKLFNIVLPRLRDFKGMSLNAFDNAGNGSGVIGDTITIKTVYSETFITGTPAQGAIPVTGSNIPGESGNGNDQNVSGDNQSETSNQDQSTGQILGSETGFGNFITNHKILSSIIGLGLLAIIIYAFKKIRKGKKSFRRK